MKMNNKGLSLVEIIIVVAIMSTLAGIMTIGFGSVLSKPVDECAEKFMSTLKNTRISTMGKQSCSVTISQAAANKPFVIKQATTDVNGHVAINETDVKSSGLVVQITTSDSTTVNLTTYKSITLTYSRETGGFNYATIEKPDGSKITNLYVKKVIFSKGSNIKEVELANLTGKVSLK